VSSVIHRTGGIAGRHNQDDARARRDRPGHGLGVDDEFVFRPGHHWHRFGTGQLGDLGVAHPVGRWNDDLVAFVQQHVEGVEQGLLGARADHDLFGVDLETMGLAQPSRGRLAQLWCPLHCGVLGGPGIERLLGGFLDVNRRIEIRLARAKADHVHALCPQLRRLGGHLQGH